MNKYSTSQNIDPRNTAWRIYAVDKHQNDIEERKNRDADIVVFVEENINKSEDSLEDILDLQIYRREIDIKIDIRTRLDVRARWEKSGLKKDDSDSDERAYAQFLVQCIVAFNIRIMIDVTIRIAYENHIKDRHHR